MNITITSSNSTVIPKVLSAVIGIGQDYVASRSRPSPRDRRRSRFPLQASQWLRSSITFLPYPASETITGGPAKIFTNQTAVISVAWPRSTGLPLAGAPVDLEGVHRRARRSLRPTRELVDHDDEHTSRHNQLDKVHEVDDRGRRSRAAGSQRHDGQDRRVHGNLPSRQGRVGADNRDDLSRTAFLRRPSTSQS